jgi:hypothetical protein
MNLAERKISLIEKIIKIEDEAVLVKLENFFSWTADELNPTKAPAFGAWSDPRSAEELQQEIKDSRLFNRNTEEL